MESITLGEISNVLVFIAGILGAGGSITLFFSKRFGKIMAAQLKPTNDKIDTLQSSISEVDITTTIPRWEAIRIFIQPLKD